MARTLSANSNHEQESAASRCSCDDDQQEFEFPLRRVRREIQTQPLLVGVAVLALDRPDGRLVFFHRIKMHHPVEDHWNESAASRVAGLLCVDRSAQAE